MTRHESQTLNPETWVQDHGDAMYRYALTRVRSREVAEDVVQEALLSALGARDSFAGRSTVRTRLIGILRHKILDHLRQTAPDRREARLEQWAEAAFSRFGKWAQPPGRWGGTPGKSEEDELRRAIDQCVDRLPGRHAEALLLTERDGHRADTVASQLDTSVGNVHVLLHRARLALRECLERNWFRADSGGEC